jgi:hypothetical protein
MSPVRLSRSPDLQRLRDEGYEVCATDLGHLVVDNVPYVNSLSQVARARIVSKLTMAGEVTTNPVTDHVVFWTGEPPCDAYGTALARHRWSRTWLQPAASRASRPRLTRITTPK